MHRSAFTLVELLVVVTLIVVLIAILMPSLRDASYTSRLTVCASNFGQQGRVLLAYAGDNTGAFPTHGYARFPTYVKDFSGTSIHDNTYSVLQGKYMPDGQILDCPVLGTTSGKGTTISTEWLNWDTTPAKKGNTHIIRQLPAIMWMFNYQKFTGSTTFVSSRDPWPTRMSDASATGALAAHLLVYAVRYPSHNAYPYDYAHKADPGRSRAIQTDPEGGPSAAVNRFQATSTTVAFGDGHVELRYADQIKARAHTSAKGSETSSTSSLWYYY